jgi:hypothetical protein
MNTLLPGTRFEGKPKEKGHLNDKIYGVAVMVDYTCYLSLFTWPCIMAQNPEMDSVPKCLERKDTAPGLNLSRSHIGIINRKLGKALPSVLV